MEFQPSFFMQDALTVAQKLLGSVITHGSCSGMIVEAEAYQADPASHAYRITPRSEIMFSTCGRWYIYFIYGMHYCLNITTNGTASPGAVLIRALEPLSGISLMQKRRKTSSTRNLCSGPGKLCQALAVTKRLNGAPFDGTLSIRPCKTVKEADIIRSKRIGIRQATELDWRFLIKGSPFVSAP